MQTNMPNIKQAKILMLATTDNMLWQFLLPHIKDLEEMGAQVDCVCHKTGFWFDEMKNSFGLNMIDINMARSPLNLVNLKAYNKLKKLQREKNYNLVYCQQPVGGMLGRLIGKKFGLPVIYTSHGMFFFKGNNPIKNFVFKTAEKFLAKSTNTLITINDEDFGATKNWKIAHKFKISGIGMNKKEDQNFDKQALKKELGIEDDNKIIVSVSEFIKRKNYKTMLQSFSNLCQQNKNIKYVLCGTGILFEKMKNFARKLKIEDKTLFLGYRKDISKILQISDVFFHQSFQEGLTMSIMEAMHFGLPVVASSARGNADLIVNGKGGFVTPPKDVGAQVDALKKILQNDELRKKMGEFNKQRVKQFEIDAVRSELKEIYKEIGLI